jgi:TolA-binding protein
MRKWHGLVLAVCLSAPALVLSQNGEKGKGDGILKKSDLQLVEKLLAARRNYEVLLTELRKLYIQTGDLERARWAEEELLQYHRINKQAFLLHLDVPNQSFRPTEEKPEATRLYREAMKYKDKGYGIDYIDNQRRAEILLQRLLTEYPHSTRISDAAYMLGDVYESKACKQYRRAAAYFERCFQWNPNTEKDARLRAARLYDRQINDRSRALQIYREIASKETDERRIEEAKNRITELSGKR